MTLVYIESMMKKVFTDRLLDFLRITTEPEDSGEIVSKGKKKRKDGKKEIRMVEK